MQLSHTWHARAEPPHWRGLNLYGVDGVVWRTPDSVQNQAAYARIANASGDAAYPQISMVCLMESSRHLLVNSPFDSVAENEMNLALGLIPSISNHSLALSDREFYSLGPLRAWQQAQPDSHWLLPLKKGTQYEVVRTMGKHCRLVRLSTTPQASSQKEMHGNLSWMVNGKGLIQECLKWAKTSIQLDQIRMPFTLKSTALHS